MRKLAAIYTALILSFVIIGLIGCGDDETVTSGPAIDRIFPSNGADDMPTTAAIMVTFDDEINPPSAGNLSFTPSVSGTVTYDASSFTLVFKPSADLIPNMDYSVEISGITNIEGDLMSPVTSEFTTVGPDTTRPEVVFTIPESGAKDIGHDEELVIKFSEPMDRTKLRGSIFFSPEIDLKQEDWQIEWGFGDEEQVTISPPPGVYAYPLNKNCTLLLSRNLTDTSGNPLLVDFKLEFRTLRYAIFDPKDPFFVVPKQARLWLYRVGNWNSKWVVIWGGTVTKGGPSGNSPAGTITASADGYIIENSVEKIPSEANDAFTVSVSKGNGNSLTYTSANVTSAKYFTMIFASTSKYVTFDLRSSSGTTPPAFVHIGKNDESPAKTPFVLRNKNIR